MQIWFHYVDYIGDSKDYSVVDWDAAKVEAIQLMGRGIHFVDKEIKSKIEALYEDDWQKAVELYNENNGVNECILYCEGRPVYF